jgi:hypothetical protein
MSIRYIILSLQFQIVEKRIKLAYCKQGLQSAAQYIYSVSKHLTAQHAIARI